MPVFVNQRGLTLLFAVSLGVWALVEIRQAFRRRTEATNRDRGSRILVGVSAFAAALLAALARKMTAASFPHGSAEFAVGLALIWAGIGLRWWSFRTLGRYFTFDVMTSADQPVITTGPYSVLRHPGYAGLLLILLGIGVSYGNWLSLAALTILPLAGFVNRIRVEEAALSAELGSAYTGYASSRKRLIPFVW
jgi:protein-S-isoprenylcysteine O-methyltransferase Ste14